MQWIYIIRGKSFNAKCHHYLAQHCSQSQLNTAFRSFHAIKVGGLEAQCSQGEPNSIPKLLSATHRVNKSHTGKAGDM